MVGWPLKVGGVGVEGTLKRRGPLVYFNSYRCERRLFVYFNSRRSQRRSLKIL